ncbi:MAG: hypothetical protein HONBIEJF_02668 [Fimbriimonadaceae bacterium]|nr:hypothetical protein [Fimbriimonadaceae bacterium]
MRSTVLICLSLAATMVGAQERGEPLKRKGFFGAQLAPLSQEARTANKLEGVGISVGNVFSGSTAEAAGIKSGDIITGINGQKVTSPQDFVRIVRNLNGGDEAKIEFLKAGKAESLNVKFVPRPMQKPDGFAVKYDQVVSKGKRIRIISTHPDKPGKHPTIFLIGGIGGYSVDGEFGTIPYGNVLAPFAKDKFATVRIDKPGMGDSEGPIYQELDFETELDAYMQALKLAKTFDFVDANQITIFGHSMGGAFGPIVASREKVAKIIVCGTVCKTWTEYFLENTRRQSALAGMGSDQLGRELLGLAPVLHYILYEGLGPEEVKAKHPELASIVNDFTPDGKTMSGVGLPFWRQLAKYNFEELWTKIDAPVLSLWGENDFISTEIDHVMIADIANKRKAGNGKYVKLAKTDHGFFTTESFADSLAKWGKGGQAFNPAVVDTMRDWLK